MFEDGLTSMYDRDKKIPMWLGGILLGLGWTTQSLLLAAVAPALIASAAVLALRRV